MSRAEAAALVSLLGGVTLTDSGLTGSPVALSGRVRLVTPRDAVAPEAAPVCYVVLSGVTTERDGIQGLTSDTYEVLLHLKTQMSNLVMPISPYQNQQLHLETDYIFLLFQKKF